MIKRSSPLFNVDTARDIVKNNSAVDFVFFNIQTDEKWLPLILSETGFFPSNGEVKKNRPDLWRELEPGMHQIELSWCRINIHYVPS